MASTGFPAGRSCPPEGGAYSEARIPGSRVLGGVCATGWRAAPRVRLIGRHIGVLGTEIEQYRDERGYGLMEGRLTGMERSLHLGQLLGAHRPLASSLEDRFVLRRLDRLPERAPGQVEGDRHQVVVAGAGIHE